MMLLVYVNEPVTSTGWSALGVVVLGALNGDAEADGVAEAVRVGADDADALGDADDATLGCVAVLIVGDADGNVASVGVGAAACGVVGTVAEHAASTALSVTTSSGRTARWSEDR
jgi:hypothetical protein